MLRLPKGFLVSWPTCFRQVLPSVWWATGVRTGHPGSMPALAGWPGCTCPPVLLINPFRPLWEAVPTLSVEALTPT